jgi:hypothetical protein
MRTWSHRALPPTFALSGSMSRGRCCNTTCSGVFSGTFQAEAAPLRRQSALSASPPSLEFSISSTSLATLITQVRRKSSSRTTEQQQPSRNGGGGGGGGGARNSAQNKARRGKGHSSRRTRHPQRADVNQADATTSSSSQTAAASPSSSHPAYAEKETVEDLPWEYDHVNVTTGKTSLEERFDAATQKVRDIFDKPLPDLPSDDGSIEPDLLVGFAFYNFRLRDQYRAMIAKMLGLHAGEVELSVGWSGRFDVSRFSNCQKVCGVRIRRASQAPQPTSTEAGGQFNVRGGERQPREPLSSELQGRIEEFIHAARKRKDESLLSLHIINATAALKEVQFTKRNAEVDAILRFLQDDLQLFTQHQAVIIHNDTTSELQWVEGRGEKIFRDRKVVPHVVSVRELCQRVAAAAADASVAALQPLRESASAQLPSTTGGSAPPQPPTTTNITSGVLAALARATREGVVRFPAVFCNGSHVGSIPQMTYLQSNVRAFDAILLRPNDISIAKKFISRLGGDQRRRDTLAADAAHAGTGRIHH